MNIKKKLSLVLKVLLYIACFNVFFHQLAFAQTPPSSFSFEKIVATGDQMPGTPFGAFLSGTPSFSEASLNESDLAFIGQKSGAHGYEAIYSARANSFNPLVDTNRSFSEEAGVGFSDFNSVSSPANIADNDSDGIPDAFDSDPDEKADGSCTEIDGVVGIAFVTYTGNEHCRASNWISTGFNVIVNDSSEVIYEAGDSIYLFPGFQVKKGGLFSAFISEESNPEIDPPLISAFASNSGPVGSLVTISGDNFAPTNTLSPQVTLNKKGGGFLIAPLASYDNQQIKVTIPAGADTGPFTVTVGQQDVTSNNSYTILASSSFSLTAAPATTQLIQGFSASYTIQLASNNGFAQLVTLSINGLPAGITAQIEPAQLAAGQQSLLTLTAAQAQPLGTTQFTVTAAAEVEGINLSETVVLAVEMLPVTTSFMGRAVIGDDQQVPLAGVTIAFLGRDGDGNPTGCTGQTISDQAGNFAFTNLPVECSGGQLIRYEGTAVTNQPGTYADVDLFYDIIEGEVTPSSVLINLPRIDDKETVMVIQNAAVDQTFKFTTIPDMEVTFYAGTTLTMKDGSQPDPFPFIVMHIPADRLPDSMPPDPNFVEPLFVAFQPANTVASQPVAVTFPNVINTPPGTTVTLMTLDPTKGVMVDYGTGTVSDTGTSIIPDLDPNYPGHRYGLVHFDWHGPILPPPPKINPVLPTTPYNRDPRLSDVNKLGSCPRCGKPVDLMTGLETDMNIDLIINGSRGDIAIERIYRSGSLELGPFGIGSGHRYSYQLDSSTPSLSPRINLIMPDGNRAPFFKNLEGLFVSNLPSMKGVTMTVVGNIKTQVRWRDGTTYHFMADTNRLSFGSVLESIEYNDGRIIRLQHNPSNSIQITKIIDPVGRQLVLTYNSNNNITSVTDPIGRTVNYSYTANGYLETVTNSEGGVTHYSYTAALQLSTITDARGIVIAEDIYSGNRVSSQKQADGSILRFSYFINRRYGRAFPFGEPGLISPQAGGGGGAIAPPPPLPITTLTDAMGNKTFYRRGNGKVLSVTDALGQNRTFKHQNLGVISDVTGTAVCNICGDSTAGDIHFTYDEQGNILTRTDGLGNSTTFTYDTAFNKVISATDPLGNTVLFSYDDKGNLIRLSDAKGNMTTFDYDSFNQLVSSTDALGQAVTMDYDTFGNRVRVTDALGNSTRFVYDAVSRLISTTDNLGRVSKITYDKLDRVVGTTDPQGNVTHFSYDEVGNLLSVTDAKNQLTQFEYDVMNRLVARIDPMGNTETYSYDLNGNLLEYTDRRGQLSQYQYDTLNRLIKITYQDASTLTFQYDAHGRLVEANDSVSGSTLITYDAIGQLLSASNAQGHIEYTYDALGRMLSRQVQGQTPVNYTYDVNSNLLSTVATQGAVSFAYDKLNRRTTLARDNGVNTTYAYDALNRLTTLSHKKGTKVLDSQSYQYNKIGNRTAQHTQLGASYQTQTTNRVYGSGNRLLKMDGTSFTYDKNGNRLTEIGPMTGTTNYLWDARNRLSQIVTADGITTTFVYDALGNLITREVSGSTNDIRQDFLVDDISNVVQSSDDQGHLAAILTGRSIDSHLAAFDDGEKTDYLLRNGINSTVASTDENGVIANQYAYEPFGETTTEGSDGDIVFQYTGRVPVAENLYYYRARLYDPKAGRFISEDPIEFGGGINTYVYTENNPLNRIDPLGLDWIYDQATGQISHRPSGGRLQPVISGYSGNGQGLNNPSAENQPNVGPIPRGTYNIGAQRNSSNTGPGILPLTPIPGTNTFGRNSFQIHGDNRQGNQSASHGCIVTNRNIRNQIATSNDNILIVQ